MVDRRGLLLAGLTGVLLPGCGGSSRDAAGPAEGPEDDPPTPTEVQGDMELLHVVLEVELQAVGLYRRMRDRRGPFPALLEHEEEHAARLRTAVRDLGGKPAVGLHPRSPISAAPLQLARKVEETQIAAYLDTLPKVSDPDLRELLATIAGTEAQHLAVVRRELGRDEAPSAFVTGRRAL